ncbi:MAG: phosphatase PAP2 family protein [Bryobacteraceae bacterium]
MLRQISSRDHRLMRRVNTWLPPRWVRFWALAASRAGDGWIWSFFGVLLLAFGEERGLAADLAGLFSAAVSIALFQLLKRLAGRKRPCQVQPHCWATLLPPDQFSFPSGHSMTAFAVTVPLALYFPALLPALLFCALSVAASRVLLGMHFVSDVVAGCVLGALIGYATYFSL